MEGSLGRHRGAIASNEATSNAAALTVYFFSLFLFFSNFPSLSNKEILVSPLRACSYSRPPAGRQENFSVLFFVWIFSTVLSSSFLDIAICTLRSKIWGRTEKQTERALGSGRLVAETAFAVSNTLSSCNANLPNCGVR